MNTTFVEMGIAFAVINLKLNGEEAVEIGMLLAESREDLISVINGVGGETIQDVLFAATLLSAKEEFFKLIVEFGGEGLLKELLG